MSGIQESVTGNKLGISVSAPGRSMGGGQSLRGIVTREWDSGAGRAGPEKHERVSFPPLCLVLILLLTEGSVWSRNVLSSLTVFLKLTV